MTEQAANPRRATVIVNPRARGVGTGFEPETVLRHLAYHGIEGSLVVPDSVAAAERAAHTAADRGHDLVFSFGGDGSLRVIAGALAGSDTALAALPAGTANVWAKEAGIPRGVAEAIAAHAAGRRVRIDLGRVNGRRFILMASAGWDAGVVHRVGGRTKRLLGPAAYGLDGVRRIAGLRGMPVRWSAGGEEREEPLAMLLAGNTRLYGGVVSFTREASARDGLLDVLALTAPSSLAVARMVGRIPLRSLHRDPAAVVRRVHEVRIETPGIPVQIDGDAAGFTPCTIDIDHGALLMSLPPGELPPVVQTL